MKAAQYAAHGAIWRLPRRVARGQQAGVLGGHGSSLTRTHARGLTEELAGAIEFVSVGCHRYRRTQPRGLDPRQVGLPVGEGLAPIAVGSLL